VLPGSVVSVLLGQPEVDEEQLVTVTADSHQEVVWLDVSVDEVFIMHVLDSADHLVSEHENSLHCKSSGAEVEEILEAGAEEVHDEYVVVSLLAVPPDVRDSNTALQDLVQFALVQQLRVSGLDALQLDGHLLPIGDVDAEVDVAETARPNLPHQPIFPPDYELRARCRGCTRHPQADSGVTGSVFRIFSVCLFSQLMSSWKKAR